MSAGGGGSRASITASAALRRLRPFALPLAFLLTCIAAAYFSSVQLAHEIGLAEEEERRSGGGTLSSSAAPSQPALLSLPHSIDEARDLSLRLSLHLRSHPSSRVYLLMLFAAIYLLKQTFSVPGSGLLNLICGFVFGSAGGVPLVALLTACGASCCYWLSRCVGGEIIRSCQSLQTRVHAMSRLIAEEKRNGTLFWYLLTLRVFPFTPNQFVNLASPLVGVPFPTFFFTILIGLLPYVYITVSAGDALRSLTILQQAASQGGVMAPLSLSDIMDGAAWMKLALLALALLLPTLLKRFVLKKDAKQLSL